MVGKRDSATEIISATPAVTSKSAPATGPLIGRSLGKFTVIEQLGKGGSGEVYRAEQTQLGRSAVIKVLRREVAAAPNKVERFLREAKLASRLDHPYAAHVYAFGAEPDGVLWIAMEHVKGITLDDLITRRGGMPAGLFAPLFGRLCEVVHTAHELGIVHRDIKGSNVMVIERAGQLLPKLLDFGIAKGEGEGEGVSPGVAGPGLTGHGSTLGSPHYMSPEQWSSPGDVDARADIYALGVLAYRCVSGELPFQGIDRAGLPQAHLELSPPALPAGVPKAVAQTIERALAKSRDGRWPSALAFGEAMSRAVGGATPEAVPIFDPASREIWIETGPQPIADAVARLAGATTTVEADAALRELVAIACRWLAVIALAQLTDDAATADVREKARAVVGRDNGAPWLWLARSVAAAIDASVPASASGDVTEEIPSKLLPELRVALAGSEPLEHLAERLDDRDRQRTFAALAADVASAAIALRPLEALLAHRLVVGVVDGAESWQGVRKRNRERVVVWGEPLAQGQVALLDASGNVVVKLSPLVQVISPLPSSEPELFFLWRSGKGQARLVAAPWGFERDDDDAAQRLSILTTEDGDTLADAKDDRSPYPGLASYGVDDAERFVGREREIEALANRLVRAPMIAVLGPSGAGKSSFIHAGVMPRLAEQYELITMRPGRHPLHTLASLPPIGTDTEDTDGIVGRLRALGERASRGLVVVIDQLEELVTLCTDPEERTKFAETLAAATSGPGSPVRVIVTIRDDFASVIESETAFRGQFDVFVLATPLPESLRRIVVEPARRAQVSVDPRVVDDMVAEVAGRPASLPLLSFTASQLWASRDRTARRITHDSYLAIGGVAGALATYADQIYGSMSKRDQEVVRDLFARLVATDGTRIPAPREELGHIPGAASVLANLIDARLLVVREDDGIDIVEIVHECLAERWPRLARWRSEDAADRALLGDVRAATRRWIEAKRRSDLLWHGKALLELRLLASRSGALTDDEREFLSDADRAEKRARRVRRVIVGVLMVALAGVAVVMAYLGLAANKSRHAAEHSAGEARTAAGLAEERLTAGLIAQGRRELNDNRGLAALAYFGEALRRGADTPGLRFMIAVASRGLRDEKLVLHERVFGITAMPEGTGGFAIGTNTGTVSFFDRDTKRIGDMSAGVGEVGLLRVRGDKMIAIGREGVAVIDIPTQKILAKLPQLLAGFADLGPGADEVTMLTDDAVVILGVDGKERRRVPFDFSTTDSEPVFGKNHVFIADGEKVQAIDLVTMKARTIADHIFAGPGGSGDGSMVHFVDQKRAVHILDGTGKEVRVFSPHQRTEGVYASYDGSRIGAIGDRLLTVYDRAGKELHSVPMSPQDEELMIRLRGDDVWTGSTHGVIRHYHAGNLVASSTTHTTEIEDFRIAGDYIISVGFDATLVVQKADSRQLVLDTPPCKAGSYQMSGTALGYLCEDGIQHIYIGRHEVGRLEDRGIMSSAFEPTSKRAAITGKNITLFDDNAVILATLTEHRGLVAFDDADHLVAITGDGAGDSTPDMWRYSISTKTWDKLAALTEEIRAIQGVTGGVFLGTKKHVVLMRGATEIHRVDVGAPVEYLSASGNGAVISAHLEGGATVLLDGKTGEIDRRLEPVESFGVAAILDQTGDLVMRTSRGTLTIWERGTGDNLVWNLEFLKGSFAAAFNTDGKIEIVGERLGLIDIPRETRPVAEILSTIECRVPLRVAGSRLEAAPVHCR